MVYIDIIASHVSIINMDKTCEKNDMYEILQCYAYMIYNAH